jgi:hypothetical protein
MDRAIRTLAEHEAYFKVNLDSFREQLPQYTHIRVDKPDLEFLPTVISGGTGYYGDTPTVYEEATVRAYSDPRADTFFVQVPVSAWLESETYEYRCWTFVGNQFGAISLDSVLALWFGDRDDRPVLPEGSHWFVDFDELLDPEVSPTY